MERFDITMLITNICTFAGTFMFTKQRKDKLLLDNDNMASNLWRELFERSDADSKQKEKLIIELNNKIFELQKENSKLLQLATLKDIEIIKLEHRKCVVKLCPKRDPQTGF